MSTSSTVGFSRSILKGFVARLEEPRRFIQVLGGPRQVGKTTLVRDALRQLGCAARFASADEPTLRDNTWIVAQWEAARLLADREPGAVLVLDEVQKLTNWSETVKRLWDEDTARGCDLRVALLGSSPLLMQRGLTESLAGRFEITRVPHWSFTEMRDAFGFSLEQFWYYGGYPGAALLVSDEERWRRYVLDALIETTLSRDLLLLTRVDKPALLRRVFELGCRYSGQVLSYTKMLGQLQDAGNSTTLAHYLDLLGGAGLLVGLHKYAGEVVRQRASSPKLQVLNTALFSAVAEESFADALADRAHRGRLVESAVGAQLAGACATNGWELMYWREGSREVDFVVKARRYITAIEVKSGPRTGRLSGLEAFASAFAPKRTLVVGGDGVSLEDFFDAPAERWIAH